jgi:3-phosphoshikimate 1-carboxyvinyltransferase
LDKKSVILNVQKTEQLSGEITIPSSKSHTIRAVIIASLAQGRSELLNPLFSEDTKAAIQACERLGAKIEKKSDNLIIEGFGRSPDKPSAVIDMLNSGTSTNLIMGILAGLGIEAEITGDASLQTRPVKSLAAALETLGCKIDFTEDNGCPPLKISGRIKGGKVTLDASKSSQYVSSLLIACPLAEQDTEIFVEDPTELPYIEMTLKWLDEQNIKYERDGFNYFRISGNQNYTSFEKSIPADWSSAAFPICAAAITESDVIIKGIDINDVQGDKAIIEYLKDMGADIRLEENGIRVKGGKLQGKKLDINATPDALPALSVMGCLAEGETKLVNVAQARVKETDRIKVMADELKKMGALIEELPDGLIIKKSRLKGTKLRGHHDHRVVMALSIAAMTADEETLIDTAEAVSVTYPNYVKTMRKLGANITLIKEVQ